MCIERQSIEDPRRLRRDNPEVIKGEVDHDSLGLGIWGMTCENRVQLAGLDNLGSGSVKHLGSSGSASERAVTLKRRRKVPLPLVLHG